MVFAFLASCLIAGLAVDISNLYRHKERLTLTADSAAHAGVVALAQGKNESDIRAAVEASVEANAAKATVGKVLNSSSDVELVRYDPYTGKLTSGSPNAVRVTLHRDDTVDNPVATTFLKFAGVDSFDITVQSVAFYGQPGKCTSSDMIYAKGQVTLTSGNVIGKNYCVHSQTSVWLPQQNTFSTGAGVSMPNYSVDCKGKCVDSANPGIEAAVFSMNLNLTTVSSHITKVVTAMRATTSDLKTAFFADKTLAASVKPLVDAKIINQSAANKLVKGSVVTLTATQFNDLMFNTAGSLPTGLVYDVDCRNNGNSPATSISIGGTKNRKNTTLATTTIETVRQVVIVSDCGFDVGPYARIDAALAISTRVSSSSVINAEEGAVIGDPLKNCDLSRKVYMMTMSGVSVNSNFTASNIALIVNGNINVAANSSSTDTVHKGTSLHAEGSIQIPANNTFNTCSEDKSGLIPSIKTYKFVMPSG